MALVRRIVPIGVMIVAVTTAASAGDEPGSEPAAPSVVPPKVEASHPDHETSANLAEKATDPSAILMQLQFQYYSYRIEDANADASTFIVQPVLPFGKKNVLRATLPAYVSAPEPTGMGDLVAIDFFLFSTPKSSLGVGPAASFPTATEDALGSGKLSLGPAFLWIYKGVPKTILGLLAENLTSVAGDSDRADVNTFLFQPIVTHHTKWGYFGWSGQQMSYDWENDRYSIPIGVKIGKVFMAKKTPWNISFEPYYTINQDRSNDYGVVFGWTAIFPKFHW